MDRRGFVKLAGASAIGVAAGLSGLSGLSGLGGAAGGRGTGASRSVLGVSAAAADAGSIIWEFPWGDRASHFGLYRGGVESVPWGPSAIRAVGDRVMIADNLNGRITGIDPDGQIGYAADTQGHSVVDIAESGAGRVVALTQGLDDPGLLSLADSEPTDMVSIGRDAIGHTVGLMGGPNGLELVTEGGSMAVPQSSFTASELQQIGSRPDNARRFDLGSRTVELTNHPVLGATISIDGHRVPLPFGNPVREVRPLEIGGDDSIVLLLLEVTDIAQTVVAQPWVAGLSTHGSLEWVARYPIEEAVYVPESPVAVAQDGRILAIVGTETSFQIRELDRNTRPSPTPWGAITAAQPAAPTERSRANAIRAACVSGSSMENTAWGYVNTSQYLDSTDINTSCARRAKPRYLGSSGTYYSVPYQWGGFHTASQYKSYMSSNQKRAGDYSTTDAWTSCASGVDCSGFVSRCWQLSDKHTTKSLPNVSYTISSAVQGDIYNKWGNHVVMVDYESGTSGVMVFESTTRSSLDRVVHNLVSWSYLSGYSRLRYDNKC